MTIFVSLPSRPPSPVSFSPPVRARSVSSRSTCSSAADSSAPAWSRSTATSVIWCLLRLGSYTVETTVPVLWPGVPVSSDGEHVLGRDSRADRAFLATGARDIEHIGSAHSAAEVELLKAAARQLSAGGRSGRLGPGAGCGGAGRAAADYRLADGLPGRLAVPRL